MDTITRKEAIIKISLVQEANQKPDGKIARDIRKTLQCDWLAEIEKVSVKNEQ